MERAINEAYGDDKKIQIIRNVDDEINIDLSKLNADGSTSSLDAAISVDLLTDSYVTSQQINGANRINLTGASPDFTRDEFLAHVQARVNEALNSYDTDSDPLPATPLATSVQDKFLVYSYFDNKPNLSVFDGQKYLAANPADVPDANGTGTNPDGDKIKYSTTENTLRIYFEYAETGRRML